ncbi:AMP-binding enzyme [Fusarium proliferatum]|nr:AMP-binding enzyme [Fusarium proliferatum]
MRQYLSEAAGDACPTEPAIWQRLQDSASKYPDRLAVASLHQPPDLYNVSNDTSKHDYLRWSYAELHVAVDRFASSLWRLGARSGMTLATILDNRVEFIIISWAAHKLGLTLVPINPRTLDHPDEADHMLSKAGVAIVVLQDADKGDLLKSQHKINIFVTGTPLNGSWTSFSALIDHELKVETTREKQMHRSPVLVLFTSGTTSKPKGVPHTDTTINAFCQNLGLGGVSDTNVFCSVLPNNHAMGCFFPLHFMMHGGAVVFPSPTFDASETAKALETESVTHFACVPTVLSALVEVLESRSTIFRSNLQDICLSGASVTPEHIRQAFTTLKSKGVSTGFGMTEGSPIWASPRNKPEDLIIGNLSISGSVSPGARVRICAPDTQTPLPVGQIGEIHETGPGTITSYLDKEEASDKFYKDEQGRTWFVTGDEGVMYADGRFSVTGRYKDMIIRGGENISPAVIEGVISQHCNIQGYVVGVLDDIAGEVPVLVLPDKGLELSSSIRDLIHRHLGPAFVPERILSLSHLGIEKVPVTSSGKIQKSQLSSIVREFLSREEEAPEPTSESQLRNPVLAAYAKATNIPADTLETTAEVSQFTDSISLMRVRAYLRKNTGLVLTAKEMSQHPTIESQIGLLQERTPDQRFDPPKELVFRGPPKLDELELLVGDVDEAQNMVSKISKVLENKGFSWSQVSDVIPMNDSLQVLQDTGFLDTCNFSIAVQTDSSSVQDLRSALQKTLPYHPILTSFVVVDSRDKAYYVTLKVQDHLWDSYMIDGGSVDTIDQFQQMAVDFHQPDLSARPGPLFSCLLTRIAETGSAGMIVYVHHVVQDASSFRLFFEDLDQSLKNTRARIIPHKDFKAWADSYHSLRHSPAATKSVKFHVQRLSDLYNHKAAVYPPARVPRQSITESPDGLDHSFDAPGLVQMREENPQISAAVVLKAAMALVNVQRTGLSHSIYFNFEAGRGQFPFLADALQALNPDTFESSDVNGPLIQHVCNLIEVPRDETTMMFLNRLQEDQVSLTANAHAPMRRIIEELDAEGNGSGKIFLDALSTQLLTWVPGLLGEHEKIQVGKIGIRCAAGLVVVASIGGPAATTYMLSMRWDVANYSRQETRAFTQDLQSAVLWLTATSNQHRPIREFLEVVDCK